MRRLERAREMMCDARTPLAEIAVAAGFADQAHFTRQFPKAFGFTPGLWRTRATKASEWNQRHARKEAAGTGMS